MVHFLDFAMQQEMMEIVAVTTGTLGSNTYLSTVFT